MTQIEARSVEVGDRLFCAGEESYGVVTEVDSYNGKVESISLILESDSVEVQATVGQLRRER